MNLLQLAKHVAAMRQAQKDYFRIPSPDRLEGRLCRSDMLETLALVARKRQAGELDKGAGALFRALMRLRLGHDLKGGAT